MPQNINQTLQAAKNTLSHANKTFPSSMAEAAGIRAPLAHLPQDNRKPLKPMPHIGDELAAKKNMVDKAVSALPKMHEGGPVTKDGGYQLKAGEHVLTAAEAGRARRHALMATGMRSLAKSVPKPAGQPKAIDDAHKKSEKKITSGVTVRPEKNQSAKIVKK